MVRSGKAVWSGADRISLVSTDPRVIAVTAQQFDEMRRRRGYDACSNSGVASLSELHEIPVSNARRLLGMGRNTGAYSRLWV